MEASLARGRRRVRHRGRALGAPAAADQPLLAADGKGAVPYELTASGGQRSGSSIDGSIDRLIHPFIQIIDSLTDE